ncbi:MAG: YiiX/YebB-like N1pC/P60 family cysteine hydrolase [bacterium]
MSKQKEAEAILQDGDIIFIRISNFLYKHVAETSCSWESHVGVVFRGEDDEWFVAESTIPVSKIKPLEMFIHKSENERFMVRRVRGGLTDDEKARLRTAAMSRMKKVYHLGFKYDSPRQYCSKFVYDIYREAIGKEVGYLQTFRQLISENPDAPVYFWRLWFFGFIPWRRKCVTTTSQLRDESLETVYDSEK